MNDRKSIRLSTFDYSQRGVYYISIGARESRPLFGARQGDRTIPSQLGELVLEQWATIPQHVPQVRLDLFRLQPTHIHGLLVFHGHREPGAPEAFGQPRPGSLSTLVRCFKASCTREWRIRSGSPHAVIWQGRYLERIVRNRQELASLRCFVRDNQLWHRLCDQDTW